MLTGRVARLLDRRLPKDQDDLDLADAVCHLRVWAWPRYRGPVDLDALRQVLTRLPLDRPTLVWLASIELMNEVRRNAHLRSTLWPQAY
jgi:hypothetical protein